ncbi:MAG: methyltransferase domain-containing protein [Deltaproteobacteria bacterium]|nr:methyltransferase domain-containing protein [Deltaproteobacteria bacterium]
MSVGSINSGNRSGNSQDYGVTTVSRSATIPWGTLALSGLLLAAVVGGKGRLVQSARRGAREWFERDRDWRQVWPAMFDEQQWRIAAQEVDLVLSHLRLPPGAALLDLPCGVGRHTLELARREFRVTAVDLNPSMLHQARWLARRFGVSPEFVREDMRRFVRPGTFDGVVNLGSSFGYFSDPADDLKVVENALRSLRRGGSLAIETAGRDLKEPIYQGRFGKWIGVRLYRGEQRLTPDGSRVHLIYEWREGERTRRCDMNFRLYSADQLRALLRRGGFRDVEMHDLSDHPLIPRAGLLAVGRR